MTRFSFAFASVLVFLVSACAEDSVSGGVDSNPGLGVGFDRQAGYIVFDQDDEPSFQTIDTIYPVLHFTGTNLDDSAIAYTSLARLKMGAEHNREPISTDDALELTLDDLVPTGELVVEMDGEAVTVSRPGEMATFAAWSPTDPNVLAYTYAKDGAYGFAVANIVGNNRSVIAEGEFSPDYLAWDDDGKHIGLYGSDASVDSSDTGFNDELFSWDEEAQWMTFEVDTHERRVDWDSQIENNFVRPSVFDPGMGLALDGGARVSMAHFLGDDAAILERQVDGKLVRSTFKAEQIRHRSRNGLAFVNFDQSIMALNASNGHGDPVPVAYAKSVTYYLPIDSSERISVQQVGVSVGGGCRLSSHIAGSKMEYAFDLREDTSGDSAVVSGTGSTYNSLNTAGYNCYDSGSDGSSCSTYDKTSTCSTSCTSSCNGYGWGNYAIIYHADGTYTKYTHMERGTVPITGSGFSASRGCYLGDEGNTGRTSGATNGCGDHIHFQRQSGGGRSDQSVSVTFSGASISATSCGSTFSGSSAGMSCAL